MKRVRISLFLISLLLLISKPVFCAVIPDHFTISDDYSLAYRTFGERIGDIYFEIYGMDIVRSADKLNFQIYTSYPQAGYKVSRWETFSGDLKIDVPTANGYKHYGVALTAHGQPTEPEPNQGAPFVAAGALYEGVDWSLSDAWAQYHGTTGYSYHTGKEVSISSFDELISQDSITWEDLGLLKTYSNGKEAYLYRINVPISLQDILPSGSGHFDVYWASASCANDFLSGSYVVPEPASISLLGLGLLGLLGLKRRKS